MRRFVLTLAALLAAPALASGEWAWATANGKDMCAGIILDCNDATTCTTVGVGPCEGDATAPTAYLKSSLVGLALVKEATYLANASDMSILNATGPGFRDFKENVDFPPIGLPSSEYAYTMAGNIFGGKGYAGVASYLATGAGDIVLQTNNFYVATGAGDTRVNRNNSESESNMGAPEGPYSACISEYTNACGPARIFKTGEYKFSIFGHLFANVDFTGRDHLGFRMKLSTVGFKVEEVKVNEATWSAAKQNDDVDTMELVHDTGTLKFDFPNDYNVGPVGEANGVMMTVTAGKTVKIKVHSVSAADQFLLIDYLFETESLGDGIYFVYDPTIKESKTGGGTPVGTTSAAPAPAPASVTTTPQPFASAPRTSVARITLAVGVVSVLAVLFGSP